MTTDVAKREGEPSTFALDVYWSSGRAGDSAVEEHVATCARCQAYLEHLDSQSGTLAVVPEMKPRSRRRWPRSAVSVAGFAAAALLVLLVLREGPTAPDGYVGVKGTPAVQVLVHRGRDTWIWDGRSPLHPGDALAFRVACEGLKRVAVASPGRAGWVRLSDAECPRDDAALPFTLRVDDEPGDERVAVVLSRDEIDDQTLQKAIEEARRAADVWVVSFVMPKKKESDR